VKNILLTGVPRIGKTTVIQKIVHMARRPCAGFYTEEIKKQKRRVGFRLVTLDDRRCTMAHTDIVSPYRVGKYHVDLRCLEEVGVCAIQDGIEAGSTIIIDEIGKMELFSEVFKDVVRSALDAPIPVVGTILARSHPFCDTIKKRHDVTIIEVSETNRTTLSAMIRQKLKL
jgi:nucleoside-triphosphatase